jgi:ubiquitin-protein ligase
MLLFHKPNFGDPLNGKARDLYDKSKKENSQEYSNEVKKWVKEYAGKEQLYKK